MKLTIESTDQLVDLGGTACRIWTATLQNGVRVVLYVAAFGGPEGADLSEISGGLADGREALTGRYDPREDAPRPALRLWLTQQEVFAFEKAFRPLEQKITAGMTVAEATMLALTEVLGEEVMAPGKDTVFTVEMAAVVEQRWEALMS